jgi:hypothetical protein
MKHLYTLCAALAVSSTALAQPPSTLPEQVQAMKACAFLSGRWSGEGWISTGPGQKVGFHETEQIETQLGGMLLLVKGQGTDAAGKTVHGALAVLSFDTQEKRYHFRAYQQMGYYIDAGAQCSNNTMSWTLDAGPTQIHYTISLTPKGQWHEVGTATPPGAPPQPVFEMTLDKVTG